MGLVERVGEGVERFGREKKPWRCVEKGEGKREGYSVRGDTTGLRLGKEWGNGWVHCEGRKT